ncbi:MAG: hypothetical protein ACRC26_12095, partial [Bacteroidales bacterium]
NFFILLLSFGLGFILISVYFKYLFSAKKILFVTKSGVKDILNLQNDKTDFIRSKNRIGKKTN